MDNCSTQSYLHKKFKKLQTSTVSNHHHQPLQQPQPQQNAVPFNDRISPPTVQNHERQTDICENVPQYQLIDKTLNDSDVPIRFSTNLRQTSSSLDSHYYDESHEPYIKRTKDDHESLTPTVKNETSPPLQVANRTSSTLDNHYYEDLSEANRKSAKDGEESADKVETSQPEKPGGKYVCNYCNLVCSKPSVLQKHIRAHTNERPFPCTSCGFSFKTRSNLYKHCRSRTHANRVMGNKAQEISNDMEVEKQEQVREPPAIEMTKTPIDMKQKPYKPRFKAFFDSSISENGESCEPPPAEPHRNLTTNVELISLHIDDLIHKNNSIMVNTNDPNMYKKRSVPENPSQPEVITNNNHQECGYRYQDLYEPHVDQRSDDEPLNLTNKNRKRCVSEIQEPTTQKSLIKELLLKNLYADANKQCPHCKMIFQTVTELDLHKYRNCKGYTKSGARYSRSSSVNVASILTQNKNAFDTNPHIPNAVFPLKSPGPCLGKTRLVESDKTKSFSFDDGIQTTTLRSSSNSAQDLMRTSQRYALSPLTLQSDKYKRPVKLFGGELVTESRPHKPDTKEDKYGRYVNTSENRVVKSALQSGGTLSEAKSAIYKREVKPPSPEIIRVYDSPTTSPTIDVVNIDKPISYERPEVIVDYSRPARPEGVSPYKYTNIMDYSQNAARRLTPKITQPTITLASLSQKSAVQPRYTAKHDRVFDKIEMPVFPKDMDGERRASENIDFAQKQILLQQKMTSEPPKIQIPYTPVNVLVNGKVIRYVPGMPGPITADTPLDMAYSSNIVTTPPAPTARLLNSRLPKPNIRITPAEAPPKYHASPTFSDRSHGERSSYIERTQPEINRSPKMSTLEIKTDLPPRITEMRSPAGDMKSPKLPESKSPIKSPSLPAIGEPPRKFARPNSLALKPAVSGSLKQHHGLTPTMFNQILISPDTPRVAKKYNHQILHGNYFSYLGLKSSTKSSYCTLNKTQPFYVPHFKKLSMYSEWRQHSGTKMDKMFASGYDPRPHGKYKYTIAKPDAEEDTILHTTYKFNVSEQPSSKEEPTKILGGYESNEDYTYVRGRGRGRFVCDQCGIRCKKPSMLKKHIRTHSNGRPYTCSHCNFSGGKMCHSSFCSFKTKGNLTKHMKSKAHNKNYTACSTNSNSSNSPPDQSGSPSSESETDDSSMDSSEHSPKTYDSDDSSNRAGPTNNDENQQYNNSSNYSEQNSMDSPNKYKQSEYDNSAMEILADIATKQEKLEKNSVAKNVASEFLKLATKNDQNSDGYMSSGKVVNDLIVESEENKSCNICSKTFIKPSLLRMHMNVHYIERPFRCDLCSISFRTKGHFQKHERSAGHKNKLLSSPNLSSSEPRPFKCTDCAIAFRIHGHLAKHLRSKMHIMKLECLNKIPFGVYAELERSNSLLTEINTADGDQCLESLRKLAKKVFTNDPSKLNQLGPTISEAAVETDS